MSPFAFADSHVHLADPAFADDVDAVVERARALGARALMCIGESPAAALRAKAIAERHKSLVWFTCGVHPHDAHTWDGDRDSFAIREAVAHGAVAVGECGLDYHYDHSPREQQRRVLDAQLSLASELDRPVVLHTREAEDDTIAFLNDAGSAGVTGVLHCFTGTHRLAEAGLAVGWYVSFSGVVTFRKFDDDALLRMIPDDRILVETDAPYLAPAPFRGKRNESSFIVQTLTKVASARSIDIPTLAQLTLSNTERFFRIAALKAPADSQAQHTDSR